MPKISKSAVDAAKTPAKGDAWLWDSEVEGFGVRIQASGRKTYMARYRTKPSDGSSPIQRKMTLARCSDIPPDKARDLARKVFGQVAEGKDPAEARKPVVSGGKQDKTVEKLFQGYIANMRAKERDSADEVERALLLAKANAADALGRARPAADVSPTDIANYLSAFFEAGHRGAADKHRGYISSAYNWALHAAHDYTVPVAKRVDFGLERNPATDVAKDHGARLTRDRNLSGKELRLLWLATAPADCPGFWPETAACVRLLILLGQRVRETLRMCGCEIDLDAAIWTMPSKKSKTGMKTGKGHVVPLPPQAIEVLKPLIAEHGDGPLFPARGGSKDELLDSQSVMQAIDRWCSQKGVDVAPFQTRDIRRTWKSRAHDAGIDRFTRDLIQQHAKQDTGSKVYDHAEYLPQKQEAMAKWGAWIHALVTVQDPEQLAA